MLQVTNSSLPSTTPTNSTVGAPIVQTSSSSTSPGAPLTIINTGANLQLPFVTPQALPITTSVTIPKSSGSATTLNVSNNVGSIASITSGGVTFTPADPGNPQPGQFIFDPSTNTLTAYTNAQYPLTQGLNLLISGGSTTAIPTDYVSGTLASALYGLPIIGQLSWSCSLEQHPTGRIQLTVLKSAISPLRQSFKKGNEINIADIGFSVSNYKEKLVNTRECPSGLYEVEISLTGKWDAHRYSRPVFLRPNAAIVSATVFQDPDCNLSFLNTQSITQETDATGAPITSTVATGNSSSIQIKTLTLPSSRAVTAQKLASQLGVSVDAPQLLVEVPLDTPRNASVELLTEIRDRLRLNGCFLNLCNPQAIQAIDATSTKKWLYSTPELEVTCLGVTDNSNSYFGYAAEYANTKLEGRFQKTLYEIAQEDTQGNAANVLPPNWQMQAPTITVIESGSVDPEKPYDYTTAIKNLSLNWDNSGDTKTKRKVTSENSQVTLEEEWIWGFAYLYADITQSSGAMNGNPLNFWQIVQYKHTEHLFDSQTGYALGSNTTGWKLSRFKRETDDDKNHATSSTLALYKFQHFPISSVTQYKLAQFSDYYLDSGKEQPPYQTYKQCLPDGSSVLKYNIDPNYAPQMFVAEELTYTNSFGQTSNPNDQHNNIITGEESFVHVRRQILPSVNTTSKVGQLTLGDTSGGDRYIEYRMETSAQNSSFADRSLRETFEEHEGQPSPATRKPPLYQKIDPTTVNIAQFFQPTQKIEYRISTPGYGLTTPSTGSFSQPHATTLDQAMTAAKTDLKIKDIQSSVQISCKLPFNGQIRPMDKIQLDTGIEAYATRVISFSNTIEIQGQLNGLPILTSPEGTSITCGIDRDIPITLNEIPQANPKLTVINPVQTAGLTLGQLISPALKTRRNY